VLGISFLYRGGGLDGLGVYNSCVENLRFGSWKCIPWDSQSVSDVPVVITTYLNLAAVENSTRR